MCRIISKTFELKIYYLQHKVFTEAYSSLLKKTGKVMKYIIIEPQLTVVTIIVLYIIIICSTEYKIFREFIVSYTVHISDLALVPR